MHETRGVRGTWVLFAGCALSLLCGCGVQVSGANGKNGTINSGGSGGAPGQASIAVTPGSLAFGNVALNTTARQTVAIASTGTAPLQITALAVTGGGFALSAAPALPLSLAPGATYTAEITLTPAASGNAAGTLSITSNATNAPAVSMALSGLGITTSYTVQLTWQAPVDDDDPIVGYNVYRAISGSGNFAQLNGAPVPTVSYSDPTAGPGDWDYVVRSVDASGAVSSPSNVYTAAIP